jgi:dCMP deaminase
VTWPPCTRCARSLIQAGVRQIIYPAGLEIPERWREDFNISSDMLREAGLTVLPVPVE